MVDFTPEPTDAERDEVDAWGDEPLGDLPGSAVAMDGAAITSEMTAVDAIVGNPPYGKYCVPDSHLTPLQRNQRGIDAALRKIETDLETLRALINERLQLTTEG